MDLFTSQSYDSDNDQTNQQPQSGLEETLRSNHSSRMDFNKNGIFVERALALIKPDAVNKADDIEAIILNHGFSILQKRRVTLTAEQCSDFYSEHYGKKFFPSLVAFMTSGPIVAMVLSKENAIQQWRELIGPTNSTVAKETHPDSIRAFFGSNEQKNAVHGSDSVVSAEREIRFFFPNCIVEPIPVGQPAKDYLEQNVNRTLIKALTALCKEKPKDPVIWLADKLMEMNPYKPKLSQIEVPLSSD
ncbi:unnamed protein product [Rotaria magnacalcarata]|uniref:Nucleoside diphosphate kinase-like domain-containing protein n=1 Tax=Rotaria magnacalcarata TaxID=392030 RepID=A0A816W816_9BILA|nr:unnamed protein product [Rotaria magnacalcarata]CAF1460992.1 unnamed protein product [Rotaria magnacalcarata]CAF2019685.1 unnamed protein product [Rotaria magnacalcarata]CAF2133992.1 unnamed protein product [Rotaria magnacalcarata]CAF3758747.1 unnamed protein product [Rotaria magnacalcarata]